MVFRNGTAGSRVPRPEYVGKLDPGVPPLPLWVHGASWEPLEARQGALLSGLPRFSESEDRGSPFFEAQTAVICLTSHQWCRITYSRNATVGSGSRAATVRIRLSWRGDSLGRRHGMAGTDKRKQSLYFPEE